MSHQRFVSPPKEYDQKVFRRIIQDMEHTSAEMNESVVIVGNRFKPVIDTLGGTVLKTKSGQIYSNEGATSTVSFQLPKVVKGLAYGFVCLSASGIRVIPNSADTMYLGDQAWSSAGNVESTTLGSIMYLIGFTAAWVALTFNGTWTVGQHFTLVQGDLALTPKKATMLVA